MYLLRLANMDGLLVVEAYHGLAMFYDISKRTQGLIFRYDYVAFDEIQSIKFTDAMEMQGALKGYLER